MIELNIGGVPEHFNLPWHLAIENNLFEKEGVKVNWTDFKGGTGVMTKALRENKVDVCVLLTEGIIADITNGNSSKIISKYLNSPLIWGIFSGVNNPIKHYGEIYNSNYAISRFGSGSHLMPIVDANSKGKTIDIKQFTVIKNLEGALNSLTALETDTFYWEKYTTKPFVDNGTLKHLGDYVTPWPCFVITATNKAIQEKKEALKKMLEVIYFTSKQFMNALNSIDEVSKRYNQKITDVEQWFYSTEWSLNNEVSEKLVNNVLHTLNFAKIIDSKPNYNDIYCDLNK